MEPEVQAEIGRMEAERRAKLLADAQSALEETRDAITALDKGDKHGALAAFGAGYREAGSDHRAGSISLPRPSRRLNHDIWISTRVSTR